MENLTFDTNKLLDTSKFVRVGDLSNFEGPLLSLFEELNNGHLYLFDWVDRDQKNNRWLIYRVSPKHLLQFINGGISHLELFEKRPNKIIYFTDIKSNNTSFSYSNSYELLNLVQNYYPNSDNFFDISDCNSFEKIKSVIINSLSRQKSENEYSLVYSVNILKHREIKSAYFNRIHNETKSIPITIRYSDVTAFENTNKLVCNNIPNKSFESFSIFKKQGLTNRKEYANQYNQRFFKKTGLAIYPS